jgi:hypothetical protein
VTERERQTIDMGTSMETEHGLTIIDALNEVTDVLAMSGSEVTFAGTKVAGLAGSGRIDGVDVYSCAGGLFILVRVSGGPHWATSGSTASEAVGAIDDEALREQVLAGLRERLLL